MCLPTISHSCKNLFVLGTKGDLPASANPKLNPGFFYVVTAFTSNLSTPRRASFHSVRAREDPVGTHAIGATLSLLPTERRCPMTQRRATHASVSALESCRCSTPHVLLCRSEGEEVPVSHARLDASIANSVGTHIRCFNSPKAQFSSNDTNEPRRTLRV